MRRFLLFMCVLLLLTGCSSSMLFGQNTIIDWVDFIKWDGKEYISTNSGVLADEKYVGRKLGEVKFKVADNVTNPSYKTKDGDAAFHEKGTVLFTVIGQPDLLAVKENSEVNGYRIYDVHMQNKRWQFKNAPLDKVKTIEIYQYSPPRLNKVDELNDAKDVQHFLQLLKTSKEDIDFQQDMTNGDPDFYHFVLYTEEEIAYKYDLFFDGTTYYWHPWETSILSNEMAAFIPKN